MLDHKEEKKYEALRKLAGDLHIPMPAAYWKLEVFDKNGKLIQEHHQRSHSWTRNAYNWLFSTMATKNISDAAPFAAGRLNFKATDASVVNSNNPLCLRAGDNADVPGIASATGYLATAALITKGIVVGSGINAESFEDFVLQTQIAEGVGAGQLNAIASNSHVITYIGLVLKDEQIRYFNNNSGGDVNINEVAIYAALAYAAMVKLAVVTRDHLGATVTVPDTGQVKVTYSIQLPYPV